LEFDSKTWETKNASVEYRTKIIALVDKAKLIVDDNLEFCLQLLPHYKAARLSRKYLQYP
jgi:hypothetical protein